jgi:hypothetical protein
LNINMSCIKSPIKIKIQLNVTKIWTQNNHYILTYNYHYAITFKKKSKYNKRKELFLFKGTPLAYLMIIVGQYIMIILSPNFGYI